MHVAAVSPAASSRPTTGRRAGAGANNSAAAAVAPRRSGIPAAPRRASGAGVPATRRTPPVRAAAETPAASTPPASAATDPAVRAAIATVRAAAAGADRPRPADLLGAILALEKAKLPPGPFFDAITGGAGAAAGGGRRWRLTFTAGAAAVKAAMKGEAEGAGVLGGGAGGYVPITAVQRWAAGGGGQRAPGQQAGVIENGVFLGWLGALAFRGTFCLDGRRLPFALETARVRVGPKWFEFPFKAGAAGPDGKPSSSGPFFLVAYVDDGVVVARGRSGGVAVWARAGDEWCARAGVDA